jgi:glutamine amidotransferase
MQQRVAVVDYGMCNLDSVVRALQECGAAAQVTDDPADLRRADRLVLPGVGSFADAMQALRDRELDKALTEEVVEGKAPFLDI